LRKRTSLRRRLVFVAWLQAAGVSVLLVVLLHLHNQGHLRDQLDKMLETRCDEVITILGQPDAFRVIGEFFLVETQYRYSSNAFFYQISDDAGQILARSENLGNATLPRPAEWQFSDAFGQVSLASVPHPKAAGTNIRVRSELVVQTLAGSVAQPLLIQTAGSLAALERTSSETLWVDVLVGASALTAVLVLLWLVTSRALQPVAAMTRKASEISAKNLRERLPVAGNADELDELATVLNSMLDRLAISLRRTEGFSSDAAHQLRTRLTRIRGEVDLALKCHASEGVRTELESIRDEVQRLSSMCGRLLLLARLDQHIGDAESIGVEATRFDEQVDLRVLVIELVEDLLPLARERGVALRCAEAPTVIVHGNRALLVEALLNLLDNAIHYSGHGGSVVVIVTGEREEACVSIADTGPGVSPEKRHRIFERFYQGDPGSSDDESSGLGLAIVRGIAQAHRGRVEVIDRPDGRTGSVFQLFLPASNA